MNQQPPNKDQIFNAVVEVDDPQQRSLMLAELCGDDSQLRMEIEDLLARDRQVGSFLEPPPSEFFAGDAGESQTAVTMSGKAAKDRSGTAIGPYKLLQQLGKGGMGEVWMAEQSEPVKRRVALKLIKSGIGSREIIARFESERQALALMNHPNIARILDAGTTENRQPYFSMELVQGPPLTTYCDQNRLGISDRLRLFADVCSGVQHAHQKGIIHRDLKPSNILVAETDGKKIPKVIDFGLAKALESTQRLTDESLFTGIGQVLGTLKYMSPEQAALEMVDIDTRTDIYSLGVVLYELLTGSTPLDNDSVRNQGFLKVLELIREKEPVKASSRLQDSRESLSKITDQRRTDSSSLNRILVGDLDWVVAKALEKDRSRRYESASGLAAEIHRFLNNEPVVARPPSTRYRVRKFVSKNRAGVLAVTLLVISLVAGIAGTSWGLLRVETARKDLQKSFAAEQKAHDEAELRRVQAESAKQLAEKNEATARQQSQLALSTLTSVIADIQSGLADLPGGAELRRRLLSTALAKLESVATEYIGQTLVDLATIDALNEMGSIIQQFGVGESMSPGNEVPNMTDERRSALKLAKSFYARAMSIAEILVESDDTGIIMQENLLASHKMLGDLSLDTGQFQEAVSHYEKVLEIQQKLSAAHPNLWISQRNLAAAHGWLGNLFTTVGKFEEAENHLQKAHQTIEIFAKKYPADIQKQSDLCASCEYMGNLCLSMNRYDEALKYFQQQLALALVIVDVNPKSIQSQRRLFVAYQNLSELCLERGALQDALKYALRFGEVTAQLASASPNDLRIKREMSLAKSNTGDVYSALGRIEEALPFYKDAIQIDKSLSKADPMNATAIRDLSVCHYKLAEAHASINEFDLAVTELNASAVLLRNMVELGFNVEQSKSELKNIEQLALIYARKELAVGDWETLLQEGEQNLPSFLVFRSINFVEQSRFSEAAQAAEKLCESENADAGQLYNAACVFCLCAASLNLNRGLELPPADESERKHWIKSALEALRKLIAAGFEDFDHMQKDSDLDVLRELPEYKDLIPSSKSSNQIKGVKWAGNGQCWLG